MTTLSSSFLCHHVAFQLLRRNKDETSDRHYIYSKTMTSRGLTLVLLFTMTAAALALSTNARSQARPSDLSLNYQRAVASVDSSSGDSLVNTMQPSGDPQTSTISDGSSSISLVNTMQTSSVSTISDEPSLLSKLTRRARVFLLAGHIFCSYKITQYKEKRLRKRLGLSMDTDIDDDHPDVVKLWDSAHDANAQRLLTGIEQLQGFWIKIGQVSEKAIYHTMMHTSQFTTVFLTLLCSIFRLEPMSCHGNT